MPSMSQIGDDRSKVTRLSTSLEDATITMMKPNSVAREVLGNEFVDHFGGTREHEVRLWNEAVTNWEGRLLCHSALFVSGADFATSSGTISGIGLANSLLNFRHGGYECCSMQVYTTV